MMIISLLYIRIILHRDHYFITFIEKGNFTISENIKNPTTRLHTGRHLQILKKSVVSKEIS